MGNDDIQVKKGSALALVARDPPSTVKDGHKVLHAIFQDAKSGLCVAFSDNDGVSFSTSQSIDRSDALTSTPITAIVTGKGDDQKDTVFYINNNSQVMMMTWVLTQPGWVSNEVSFTDASGGAAKNLVVANGSGLAVVVEPSKTDDSSNLRLYCVTSKGLLQEFLFSAESQSWKLGVPLSQTPTPLSKLSALSYWDGDNGAQVRVYYQKSNLASYDLYECAWSDKRQSWKAGALAEKMSKQILHGLAATRVNSTQAWLQVYEVGDDNTINTWRNIGGGWSKQPTDQKIISASQLGLTTWVAASGPTIRLLAQDSPTSNLIMGYKLDKPDSNNLDTLSQFPQ